MHLSIYAAIKFRAQKAVTNTNSRIENWFLNSHKVVSQATWSKQLHPTLDVQTLKKQLYPSNKFEVK